MSLFSLQLSFETYSATNIKRVAQYIDRVKVKLSL